MTNPTEPDLMALADQYAYSRAKWYLESLYGTSKTYTQCCAEERDEDRNALSETIITLQSNLDAAEARVRELGKHLSIIVDNDTYQTEYDGRMITCCHGCDYDEEHGHKDNCTYVLANAALSEETPK